MISPNRFLFGLQSLLLHDRFYLGPIRRVANNSPIARRIVRLRGQNRHRSAFRQMQRHQVLQRLRLNERHIAGENKDVLVPCDRLARALNGVTGSALLLLLDELNAGAGHRLPHTLRLVADDCVNILVLRQAAGCGDYMAQQRFAADLVKNFGPPRL